MTTVFTHTEFTERTAVSLQHVQCVSKKGSIKPPQQSTSQMWSFTFPWKLHLLRVQDKQLHSPFSLLRCNTDQPFKLLDRARVTPFELLLWFSLCYGYERVSCLVQLGVPGDNPNRRIDMSNLLQSNLTSKHCARGQITAHFLCKWDGTPHYILQN